MGGSDMAVWGAVATVFAFLAIRSRLKGKSRRDVLDWIFRVTPEEKQMRELVKNTWKSARIVDHGLGSRRRWTLKIDPREVNAHPATKEARRRAAEIVNTSRKRNKRK